MDVAGQTLPSYAYTVTGILYSANSVVTNTIVVTRFADLVTTPPSTDLGMVKSGPGYTFAGSNYTYTITVTNSGPDSADGVVVTDSLPAGVTFVSASGGGMNNGGVITWSLGTLAVGATSNVTVTVKAPVYGSLTNSASVGSSTLDPNPANNTSANVITVVAPIFVWRGQGHHRLECASRRHLQHSVVSQRGWAVCPDCHRADIEPIHGQCTHNPADGLLPDHQPINKPAEILTLN